MAGYDPSRWSEFALAQLGASAAVLGLVFVALSINLRAIIGSDVLVHRATEAVIVLANVLVNAVLLGVEGAGADTRLERA